MSTVKQPLNQGILKAISRSEVYRLSDAMRILGWKQHALRTAKRQGLRVVPFGRSKYVLGSDLHEFFQRLADAQATEGR